MLRPIIQPRMKEEGKENIKSLCFFLYCFLAHFCCFFLPPPPPNLLSGLVLFCLFVFLPFKILFAGTITLTTTLLSTDDNNDENRQEWGPVGIGGQQRRGGFFFLRFY